jgi:signal peptidase I
MTGKSWRRTGTWALRLLLLAVISFAAFAISVLMLLPRATHAQAMTVLTGSMTPGIPVGSVVLVRPVDPGTLRVGDVATYQKEPGKAAYITHRIVRIDTTTSPVSFIFKCDANRGADVDPVPATAIRGKVWFHVPYLGAIRDTLQTGGGLAGIAVVVCFGYAVVQLAGVWRGRRSRGDAVPALVLPVTEFEQELQEQRVMILTTLRLDAFDGLGPRAVARLLNGILVDDDGTTFTLLIADRESRATETMRLIRAFEPLSLETVPPATPRPPAPLSAVDLRERSLVGVDA